MVLIEKYEDRYVTTADYEGNPITVSGGADADKSMTVTIEAGKDTITVTNHKDVTPDTGIHLTSLPYIITLMLILRALWYL